MNNFDAACAAFEATWRNGSPEDLIQEVIDEEIDKLCSDEDFLDWSGEEHSGGLSSANDCARLQMLFDKNQL